MPKSTPLMESRLEISRSGAPHDSVETVLHAYRKDLRSMDQMLHFFQGIRRLKEGSEIEINPFLWDLVVPRKVFASTRKQAMGDIVFLYKQVLESTLFSSLPALD